jgi:hypothetical protein
MVDFGSECVKGTIDPGIDVPPLITYLSALKCVFVLILDFTAFFINDKTV